MKFAPIYTKRDIALRDEFRKMLERPATTDVPNALTIWPDGPAEQPPKQPAVKPEQG